MINDILQDARTRMGKSVDSLKSDFTRIRTGRANPGLIETVEIDYYGVPTPLKQVAKISTEDARTLMVTPWEKNLVKAIEKGIMDAGLGLNPSSAGTVIRVPMPPLTEERRRDLIKVVRQEAEGGRVAIRNIRRDAITMVKTLAKEKDISEDEAKHAEDEIQKLTNQFIGKVDDVLELKEKELMEI